VQVRDGRVLRGELTRRRVVDALLALIDERSHRPSAREIAERAGVSLRSMYVHFEDREALFLAVAAEHARRIGELIDPIPPSAAFEERLAEWTRQHALIYEASAALRHAATIEAAGSPAIEASSANGRAFLRAWLEEVFAPELDALDPGERAWRSALAESVSSGQLWDRLRESGLDPERARLACIDALRSALCPGGECPDRDERRPTPMRRGRTA
jgi:AcrR family transcriptional regulator